MKLIAELLYYFYKAKVLLRGKGAGRKTMALSRGAFYARAWQDAADHLQASITSLGGGVFEVTKGTRQAYVYLNHSPLDDSATVAMTLNKAVVSKRLAAAGIPVPKYLEFGLGEFHLAKDFVQALSVSAVVKPAFGTGGGAAGAYGNRTGRGSLIREGGSEATEAAVLAALMWLSLATTNGHAKAADDRRALAATMTAAERAEAARRVRAWPDRRRRSDSGTTLLPGR